MTSVSPFEFPDGLALSVMIFPEESVALKYVPCCIFTRVKRTTLFISGLKKNCITPSLLAFIEEVSLL
jgi:hypothetical protein